MISLSATNGEVLCWFSAEFKADGDALCVMLSCRRSIAELIRLKLESKSSSESLPELQSERTPDRTSDIDGATAAD